MKRLIVLLLLVGGFAAQAQLEFEGSERHGILSNFAYDHTVQDKIYASTANKLMVSTDNGDNWSVIYSSPTFSEVTNLKVINEGELVFQEHYGNSLNNSIVVLNLSDHNVSKRIEIPSIYGVAEIDAFDIMASNSDVVFLHLNVSSTKGYGMYTNNAGQTWHTVYNSENYTDNIKITSLAISDSNPNKLVITRGIGNIVNNYEGGGVWISENAGNTWTTHLENTLLRRVAINPTDDNEILVGTALRWNVPAQPQAVFRTKDNGQQWDGIDVEWDEGWGGGSLNYITGIYFNPHQSGNIVILGDNEIVSTIDDGDTWRNTTYPGGPEVNVESYFHAKQTSFDPFRPGTQLLSNSYYPLKTEDGGLTTERFYNPFYPVTGDVSVFTHDLTTQVYHGVQHGYVFQDIETGEEVDIDVYSLDTRFQFGPPLVRLQADKEIEGRVLIYTTASFGIHLKVSNDYGQTKELLYQNTMYRYSSMRIDPADRQVVWLNLEDVNSTPTLMRIDFNDMANIQREIITLPGQGKLYSIEIDPADSSHIYLGLGNKVYFSEDSGGSWEEITNELDQVLGSQDYVLSVKRNALDSEQLTIATNKGVFTTYDKGTNWEELYTADVLYIEHSSVVDGHLVALAYTAPGEQTFYIAYSADNGETWEEISNEELNYAEANNMADAVFSEETIKLYIGTTSLGLIGYEIDLSSLSTGNISVSKNDFKVYPNPSSDIVTISSTNNEAPLLLRVYSLTGSKLLEIENTGTLSVSNLQHGIYFIEIIGHNGEKETHRLIKN